MINPQTGDEPVLNATAFTIDGHMITQNLGVVRGVSVRSRSIFGNIGAGFRMRVVGNAMLGVRCDATEIIESVTEVLCRGTAVVAEKNRV